MIYSQANLYSLSLFEDIPMKRKSFLVLIGLILFSLFISGCAQNISPNSYPVSEIGMASRVIPGVIVAKRHVHIDANSGIGGLAGAATGAVAGSNIGGSSAANLLGAIGGAVVGGMAGNSIDQSMNRHIGLEYIIKLKDGNTISVVQAPNCQFGINQHVLVIYGAKTRIIADNRVKYEIVKKVKVKQKNLAKV